MSQVPVLGHATVDLRTRSQGPRSEMMEQFDNPVLDRQISLIENDLRRAYQANWRGKPRTVKNRLNDAKRRIDWLLEQQVGAK